MNKKTKRNTAEEDRTLWNGPPIALFWDQSLVWGLICLETLRGMCVPCRLLSAADIAAGQLDRHRVLLVPGGWASHKVRALGEAGKNRIKDFVERGGSYLGFCGGAGLALSSPPALGLVPLERLPFSERLPNASGEIMVRCASDHPAFGDIPKILPVSIWWPSQFFRQALQGSLCLATYEATGADFWVADLPVADMVEHGISWDEWERIYGINLNPERILGHPAIVEMPLGTGRLVLSYPHLETPDERWGNRLFLNLLQYLDGEASRSFPRETSCERPESLNCSPPGSRATEVLMTALDMVEDLILFGERHLLWRWRNPWLLHWRRGIRGLEYGTLAVSLRSLVAEAQEIAWDSRKGSTDPWLEKARDLEADIRTFCCLAQRLLLEEKLAAYVGSLRKLGTVNETVDQLRESLFGSKMNHGGLCRAIFDRLDTLLFLMISRQDVRE